MSVGVALREARILAQRTQKDVAKQLHYSPKTVSAFEGDRRPVTDDAKPAIARAMDDPRVFVELALEATGGVGPMWLDGQKVDLHRASVRDKATEELAEAVRALAACKALANAKGPDDLDDDGRRQIEEALHQLVEAQTALCMMIGVMCRAYGVSMQRLYDEHRRELEAKGYIQKRREPPPLAR